MDLGRLSGQIVSKAHRVFDHVDSILISHSQHVKGNGSKKDAFSSVGDVHL